MKLFETLEDLKPFIFRITDNGGRTADRFTVTTCDGDYFAMSSRPFHPQGFGQTGEGIDVQGIEERVESGEERDLRWIDLPEDCQRCVMDGLNRGFEDFLEAAPAAATRDAAGDYDGIWRPNGRDKLPIYRDGDKFRIRDSDRAYTGEEEESFDTFREALLYILPDDYALSGPEYQTPVDLWDTTGGPAPLWDYEEEDSERDEEDA